MTTDDASLDVATTLEVDAKPTKRFFIEMLVRDIGLLRAIADLVDNSVDKAIERAMSAPHPNFSPYAVHIRFSPDSFQIEDNCGGMPIQVATDYAFRFGRSDDAPTVERSVGQFGVGMKRAIFKMGRRFKVESFVSADDRFVLDVDVKEWERKDAWTFDLRPDTEADPPLQMPGTRITVSDLRDEVIDEFGQNGFANLLRREIESAHQLNISEGLTITVQDDPLPERANRLLYHPDVIEPARWTTEIPGERDEDVISVEIIAGAARNPNSSSAGWDVFCNRRMVLERDQTNATGWGSTTRGTQIPRYHNQFSMFRGFVFLECANASRLPWNTTKTGIDTDAPVWRGIRHQMMLIMRQVINFLNALDAEKDRAKSETPLYSTLESEQTREPTLPELRQLHLKSSFRAPSGSGVAARVSRISYLVDKDQAEAVRNYLEASTLKETGELTFKAFYDRHIER